MEDWRIGGLKDWRIERLEDWRIGGLKDWRIERLEDWGIESPNHKSTNPPM